MADSTTPQVAQDNAVLNLVDFGNRWGVSLFVPKGQLRTLSGNRIVGIEERPQGGLRPTYAENEWLDKAFMIFVPKIEGVYNLSARHLEQGAEVPTFESMQVEVKGNGAEATIHKLGYKDMLQHFGADLTPTTPVVSTLS